MSNQFKKYQPDRQDILWNTDWGIAQSDLQAQEAERQSLVLYKGRWVGQPEKAILQRQVRTYSRVQVIGVVFRWMGVLLLISAVIGLITFLTNATKWIWELDVVWIAGIGFIVFVPLFLVGWTFLRTGLGLSKFVPQARRFAIGISIAGLPSITLGIPCLLMILMPPQVFVKLLLEKSLYIVLAWGTLTTLFVGTLLVLRSATSQLIFFGSSPVPAGSAFDADRGAEDQSVGQTALTRPREVQGNQPIQPAPTTTVNMKKNFEFSRQTRKAVNAQAANSVEDNLKGNDTPGGNKNRRKISAKEVLADIKAGMDDITIMQKYGLSARQLTALYKKMEDAGLLIESRG